MTNKTLRQYFNKLNYIKIVFSPNHHCFYVNIYQYKNNILISYKQFNDYFNAQSYALNLKDK
jgi:hypothetical protein